MPSLNRSLAWDIWPADGETTMTYVINYISGESETSERWVGSLPFAQAVARRAVANGTAQHVKILDRDGAVIFKHPRTPAP